MGIKRWVADADNSITNAFEPNLVTRGTGSNMGAADSLEVFMLYGQASASSTNSSLGLQAGNTRELSRILIKFPTTEISASRTSGSIPESGSVSFHLRMFNAEHPFTLPENYELVVVPISASWEEGTGLDMDNYTDLTYNESGSNWLRRGNTSSFAGVGPDVGTWQAGGTYNSASGDFNYTASFAKGYEDLDVDITGLVEHWFSGAWGGLPGEGYTNYGVVVKLIQSLESGSISYYTKKFFARSTEFFFKKPVIEARWDSRTEDDRGNMFLSSALVPAVDNLNSLFLYNYVNGRLVDIPTLGAENKIYVSLYSGTTAPAGHALHLPVGGGVTAAGHTNITGNRVSTGVYSASFAVTGGHSLTVGDTLTTIFDVWHTGTSQAIRYLTSSFEIKQRIAHTEAPTFEYITNVTNLRAEYSRKDTARFRFFVREKNWNPNIYDVATSTTPNKSIVSASYRISRTADDLTVISYGTGSKYSTYLSHDLSGNYFDLDINLLESDYSYKINVSFYNPSIGSWVEQPQEFKFRVVE